MSQPFDFTPLSYRPTTPLERLWDVMRYRWRCLSSFVQGMPIPTRGQWYIDQTVLRRSVLARRAYFFLCVSPAYPRTAEALSTVLVPIYETEDATPPQKAEIEDALTELREHGLLDSAWRPRMPYEIVG